MTFKNWKVIVHGENYIQGYQLDENGSMTLLFDIYYMEDIQQILPIGKEKLMIVGHNTFDIMDENQKILQKNHTTSRIQSLTIIENQSENDLNFIYVFSHRR